MSKGHAKLTPKQQRIVGAAVHEFKRGRLRSGGPAGKKVTDRRQAIAIALNEARRRK